MIPQPAVSTSLHWCKFFSLQLIIMGHFFTDVLPLMWIPAGAALVLFGFASGYTGSASVYRSPSCWHYWWYKLSKFYPSFWVLNLGILLSTQEWPTHPIALWQTLCHMLGGTGILNWLAIKNQSVLGSALWFVTVLLLSWVCAPFAKRWYQHLWALRIIPTAVVLIFCTVLWHADLTLALTVWGFYCGSVLGAHNMALSTHAAYWGKQWLYILGILTALCVLLAIPLKSLVAVACILSQAFAMLYICGKGWLCHWPRVAHYTQQVAWPLYVWHPYVKLHVVDNIVGNYIVSLSALCALSVLFCVAIDWLKITQRQH